MDENNIKDSSLANDITSQNEVPTAQEMLSQMVTKAFQAYSKLVEIPKVSAQSLAIQFGGLIVKCVNSDAYTEKGKTGIEKIVILLNSLEHGKKIDAKLSVEERQHILSNLSK